jgi:predicted ATPase
LLEARLDKLAKGDREVLEAGSIIGDKFNQKVVADLLGRDLTDGLSRLIDTGLIHASGPGEYTFKHTLIREATYRQLTRREK